MKSTKLTITEAADLLGVTAQTLRRWDNEGVLKSHRKTVGGFRYYETSELEPFFEEAFLDVEKAALTWISGDGSWTPLQLFYCSTSNVFQLRLHTLETTLATKKGLEAIFPLITASVGEIGNNAFDHNLGNWPDMPGLFFGFDKKRSKIVLADHGQGILRTISRVRTSLQTHEEALRVAFTEVLTGRAPEHRGNGLKFVRKIIEMNPFLLTFQTGDARLILKYGDKDLSINKTETAIQGCFAILSFNNV